MNLKNILIGIGTTVFLSLFYLLGTLDIIGNQVYDFLLGFRLQREETGYVVFLDVDDNAIAYNGVFPWPRSITADALLRLKEFGALAAVFDIEYIDRGPPGVDSIYLRQGLSADFSRSFSEISSAVGDMISSIMSGRMSITDIDEYSRLLQGLINDERIDLYTRAQRIARDNDLYLVQSSTLFGRSWATLNLREEPLEDEEQLSRRPMAEELFSHPVIAMPNAVKGEYVDILPAFSGFAHAAKGAGFTNVVVDRDGKRRRVDLAQNIHDHWYLQLAFAPLVNYFDNPSLVFSNRRMILKDAKMPWGMTKDISIPLDENGRMILDWPLEDYHDKYTHISFHDFSLLEDLEAELELYSRALNAIDFFFYTRFDSELRRIPIIIGQLERLFDAIYDARDAALEQTSEEYFYRFIEDRRQSRDLIQEFLDLEPTSRLNEMLPDLFDAFPDYTEFFIEDTEYIQDLENALSLNLYRYFEITSKIENTVRDKFCIIGRVDTGTTDIGTNPFHARYVNVGTHGVVIDMILSDIFINPIAKLWHVLLTLVFVFSFFILSARFSPVPRAISGFLVTILFTLTAALVFRYTGAFFNPLLTVLAMISAVIIREIVSYASSEREKQFIRKAFSTYVSSDVVKEIIADPSRLQLGGTNRYMTAVFTDVKGFSGISEQLSPEGLVSLLNNYLSVMSDIVLEEKGTIDKYIGDAIVAFFGAPLVLEDHALRACISAIRMRKAEAELNKSVIERNASPIPLMTRIGINTGYMVAGNMGTGNKMNYTIMGNAVNLAARLEGVNNQYGTWILATEDTIKETGDQILSRRIDRVRVVGINEPVQFYELINTMEEAESKQIKLVEIFHEALALFQERKWKEAMGGFSESFTYDGDGPSLVYMERCKNFLVDPPPDDWDGVRNLTEKK